MPIINRRIGYDNLDIPNQPSAPARPDYRRAEYEPPARPPIGPRTTAILIGFGVVLAGVLAYIVIRFVNYIAAVNSGDAPTLDQKLLTAVKLALTFGIILLIAASVVLVVVFIAQKMIVRMQNAHPVSVFDIIGGWRRTNPLNLSRDALGWYYDERRQWAKASLYWSLNTLDLSSASRNDNYGPQNDVIEGEVEAVDNLAMLPALTGTDLMIKRLIDSGLINRSGNSLLVGFSDPKTPLYIELEETGFIALAGQPRVGKSATAALIASQVAMIPDSLLIVCDKHGRKPDSLLSRLTPIAHRITRTAVDTDEIIAAIDFWHEEGSNRLLDDNESKQKYPPCFLIIDEFTAMILLGLLPASIIQKLVSAAVEFPKVQTHGLIIGHQWTGKLLGNALGAPLRRVTTQRIIHRIDPQDAEFLIPPAYAKQCQTLPDGRAIFMGASQSTPIEMTVPYLTSTDLDYLSGLLPKSPAHRQPITPNVAAVTRVADALESGNASATTAETSADDIDLDPDADPASAVDLTPEQYTIDRRARLAKLLLRQQDANGKYSYGYRQVQAMTNLRTATICSLAIAVGRARRAS